MNMTRLVLTAALVLSTASSFAAPGPLDLSTGSAGFSNTPTVGSFTDSFTFTIMTSNTINGSVTAVVNGNQDVDFTSIAISGPSGTFAFSQLLNDPVEVWALPGAGNVLGAGAYTLTLMGSNSTGIGSYGGNLAVTPVPEPQTLALVLAGIGAVGFVARRRKA